MTKNKTKAPESEKILYTPPTWDIKVEVRIVDEIEF